MRWLWYVGPIVVAIVYLWTALVPTRRERWRLRELRRWVKDFLGPLPSDAPAGKTKRPELAAPAAPSRLVGRLPPAFDELLERVGLGRTVGNVTLVPKLAYLAVRGANRVGGSDHQTVIAKLGKPAPAFVVRPMPVVEGRRQEGTGVEFDNDPAFSEQFLVEGSDAKAIRRWLDSAARETLLELPGAWLRVEGRHLALTLYGDADADRLDELVGAADALFAERGSGGAPSLFGEPQDDDEGDEAAADAAASREEPADKHRARRGEPDRSAAGAKGAKGAKTRAKAKASPPEELLAPVGTRVGAFVVDALLYVAAAAVMVGVLSLREEGLGGLWGFGAGIADEYDGGWQGGWDTKGFGALVVAEGLLLGVFVLQTYWAARRGQTIGQRLLGARVVQLGGQAVEFFRGVALRTWVLSLVPVAFAFAVTKPLQFRPLLANLISLKALGLLAVVILIDALVMLVGGGRRALHDYLTGTKVVVAPRDLFDALKRG